MIYPKIKIEFPAQEAFVMHFGNDGMSIDNVPPWTQLKYSSCPGNEHHQPQNDYCRLAVELERLILYFSTIPSFTQGKITFHKDRETHISISKDAQHVFCNAIWFILLHSDCFMFKHNQWLRKHYLPPSEKTDMFYTLFSTFVMEELFLSPETPLDLNKFQEQMDLLRGVFNSLLKQINQGLTLTEDSVNNGLVILNNMIHLIEIGFDKIYMELEHHIMDGSHLKYNGEAQEKDRSLSPSCS